MGGREGGREGDSVACLLAPFPLLVSALPPLLWPSALFWHMSAGGMPRAWTLVGGVRGEPADETHYSAHSESPGPPKMRGPRS